jgi:hypothetical protein
MFRNMNALLFFVLAAAGGAQAAEPASTLACPVDVGTRWAGPDDTTLPFRCEAELLDFLREAPVVASKVLTSGSTKPLRLTLERDGVRARAIFRHVDSERYDQRLSDGRFYKVLRDSWRHDVAAYELARLLGIDSIPPTVYRRVDGREGAVQLWIEHAQGAASYHDRAWAPGALRAFARSALEMQAFDALVANVDRNKGNMLLDPSGRLWWIDHSRAFALHQPLVAPENLEVAALVDRLDAVPEALLRERLEPWLSPFEVGELLRRRTRLLELATAERKAHQGPDVGSIRP